MFHRQLCGTGLLAVAAWAALAPLAASADTSGSFIVNWTDRVGNLHPLLNNQVTIYDEDASTGARTSLGTWVTDNTGKLTFTTSNTHAGGGPLRITLDVTPTVTSVGT